MTALTNLERGHIGRLMEISERFRRQAHGARCADSTRKGEEVAQKVEREAAAIDWALRAIDSTGAKQAAVELWDEEQKARRLAYGVAS